MAAFVWGDAGAQMTPEAIAAQRKIAQAMMARSGDYSPIQSPWQGVARVAEGLAGGLDARTADAAEKRNATAEQALLASLIPGAAASAPAAPAAPAAAPAVAGDASLPRGIRNNNPLNIEAGTFTSSQPGFVGSDGRFARFETPEAGVAAASRLLDTYEKKHGLNTVAGIIGRWAPTSDGNNVSAYAANVSRQLGIDPNAPIPPEKRMALIAAMGQHENGRPINMGGAAADPAALPANAQPAQGYAVPGATPAQAVAQAMPQSSARLMAAMASPYVSEGTKKVLGIMLQSQLSSEGVSTVDAGNKIIVMDKRGNVVREMAKGEPNKGPEFVETGQVDPQTGEKLKGWVDPRDKSVVPYRPQPAAPVQSTIPPVPAGVDPKVWREAQSKRAASEGMPASGDDTSKLRNEIQGLPSYKNIAQAAPVYKSMLEAAGRDTRAADVNMIYGMAKIMDPGSVVRESEMSVAQAIATLPQQLQAAVKSQLTESGRLTPELRQAIMQEAHSRIGAYQSMFDQDAGMYRGIAQRNRMNEADVLPSFGPYEQFKPVTIKPAAPVTIDGYTIKAK